jgi:ankyrin repeat protein
VYNDRGALIKVLIERGYDINVVDKHGNTPLYLAEEDETDHLVKLLVKSGARV